MFKSYRISGNEIIVEIIERENRTEERYLKQQTKIKITNNNEKINVRSYVDLSSQNHN